MKRIAPRTWKTEIHGAEYTLIKTQGAKHWTAFDADGAEYATGYSRRSAYTRALLKSWRANFEPVEAPEPTEAEVKAAEARTLKPLKRSAARSFLNLWSICRNTAELAAYFDTPRDQTYTEIATRNWGQMINLWNDPSNHYSR